MLNTGINTDNIDKPMAVSTKKDTTVASTSASTTNCIYDKAKDEAKVNEKVSSEIDKILEKVCEKYKKYGITVEQLKQIPLIQDICKAKDEDLAKFFTPNSPQINSVEMFMAMAKGIYVNYQLAFILFALMIFIVIVGISVLNIVKEKKRGY